MNHLKVRREHFTVYQREQSNARYRKLFSAPAAARHLDAAQPPPTRRLCGRGLRLPEDVKQHSGGQSDYLWGMLAARKRACAETAKEYLPKPTLQPCSAERRRK